MDFPRTRATATIATRLEPKNMPHRPIEMTRQPDLAHERRTGPLRTQRPVYVDLLPPCNHACPAGENWLVRMR